MCDLLALAERCEKATGPDCWILDAVIHFTIPSSVGCGMAQDAPAYTASIDAALTLVPEGWRLDHLADKRLSEGAIAVVSPARVMPEHALGAEAATPALALCAAALKARAQTGAEYER